MKSPMNNLRAVGWTPLPEMTCLLYGFIAERKSGNDFVVTGDFLSYDPYGIMYQKR